MRLVLFFCILSVCSFAQTQIDSGQIRRIPIAKLVTSTTPTNGQVIKYNSTTGKWEPGTDSGGSVSLPVNRIAFGNGTGIQTDPRILVDSTLKAVVVNGTGTKVSKTSIQPGYIELRGDTTQDNNVFLKILGGRSSTHTYAPFGLSVEYANAAQYPPYRNYVWTIGPNAAGNSGITFEPGKPMASKNWETSWLDSGVPRFEIHEHWKIPDSSIIRLNSYTITYPNIAVSGNRLIDIDKYESADRFYVKHWKQDNAYFSTSWNRATRLGNHQFQTSETQGLKIAGVEDTGTAFALIQNPNGLASGKDRRLVFDGWDRVDFTGLNDGFVTSTRTFYANSFSANLTIGAPKMYINSGMSNGIFIDAFSFIRSGPSQVDFFAGFIAGPNSGYSGGGNIGIGYQTTNNLTTGSNNVVIGTLAANNLSTGENNVVFGNQAMRGLGNFTEKLWIESSNSSTPLLSGDFSTNNVGINIANAAPTARLHIGVGSATASTAPLKFTSGTNLSTPEAGAVEYDGVNFYGTDDSRRQVFLRGYTGTGSPESVVTAPVGSIYLRTDGGSGTSFYVKESGTGNTGWVAK